MSDEDAYGTLNMGAGFALFVSAADAERTVEVARQAGVAALVAGRVEAGPKQLLIEPLGLAFGSDALQLRGAAPLPSHGSRAARVPRQRHPHPLAYNPP
jgi:hypothetical protein